MDQHEFLSEAWITEARRLREAARATEPAPSVELRMNLVISATPFSSEPLAAFIDSSGGTLDVELGALEHPDVTVRLDYDTARAILVEANGEAAMQAFMAGRVQVEGDMTKLLQFQSTPIDPSRGVAAQVREMTR